MGKKIDKINRLKKIVNKKQNVLTETEKRTLRMGIKEGWLTLHRDNKFILATDKLNEI